MELTLILGPMKSGKSLELINHFKALERKGVKFSLYHSLKNVRDKNIWSRKGVEMEAKKIESLFDIRANGSKVIGIDEIHMFDSGEISAVEQLLKRGIKIIASGLDTDYRGKKFQIVEKLLGLKPKKIEYRYSNCEICGKKAIFSQIYEGSKPVLEGLPPCVPDDGAHTYKPLCANCFVKK